MTEPNKSMLNDFLPQLKSLIQSESVFGEPYQVGEVTLIPVNSVRIGFGFGGKDLERDPSKTGSGGGGGVVLKPEAFLVVKDGDVSIHTLASGSIENIMDRVPTVIDQLAKVFEKVTKKPKPDAETQE